MSFHQGDVPRRFHRIPRAFFLAALLSMGIAVMLQGGSGTYNPALGSSAPGVFDLTVSVRFSAVGDEKGWIEDVLQSANDLLVDATDGEMRFGEITIFNNTRCGQWADIWIIEKDWWKFWTSCPTDCAMAKGLGSIRLWDWTSQKRGFRVNHYWCTFNGHSTRPAETVVHEWGHYALGLYDEYCQDEGGSCVYQVDGNDVECVQTPSIASLMDGYYGSPPPSEFCGPWGHDPDEDTKQQQVNKASCWETITKHYAGLGVDIPLAAPQPGPESPFDVEITWVENAAMHVTLLFDLSASAPAESDSAVTYLENLKVSASSFVEHMKKTETELSIVGYYGGSSSAVELTGARLSHSNLYDLAIETINALKLGESAGATGGLELALAGAAGCLPSDDSRGPRAVVLMTGNGVDSAPGDGPNNVHVFTLSVGRDATSQELRDLAMRSGGVFQEASGSIESAPGLATIASYLMDGEPLDCAWKGEVLPGETLTLEPLRVQSGSELVQLLLAWDSGVDDLELELTTPSGIRVTRCDSLAGICWCVQDQFVHVSIENPEAGYWGVDIDGSVAWLPVGYVFQSTVVHPKLRFHTYVERMTTSDGRDAVWLGAVPTYDDPLVDVAVVVAAYQASGAYDLVTLRDDGDPADGDGLAADGIYSAQYILPTSLDHADVSYLFAAESTDVTHRVLGEPIQVQDDRRLPNSDTTFFPVPGFRRRISMGSVVPPTSVVLGLGGRLDSRVRELLAPRPVVVQ